MSLTVEVYVGSATSRHRRRLIAHGVIHNVSNLSDVSDYEGYIEEFGTSSLDIPFTKKEIKIAEHARKQSVWKLVEKMAQAHD